ncbi:E3 SUMO-protein ligase PIAS2-like [Adelges cooleyi]|uniref:E3 SUMO-protein ligase PIAS2-like n=1 Tax=Adelges cooleyi TaxID=133065 RepID=UPI002180037D|nr:E3 SUMO-protein ligase PIAS2-like [Adelges cooleyi]XP_050434324.1 E3 SUMO-protein ligase PIAS2-like [Adelges cooleyi]
MTHSYTEDTYKNMLSQFRTNDLQALLGAFGFNRAGRKSEIRDRAVELLRNRAVGFNLTAYLSKIVEIHRSIQSNDLNMIRNILPSHPRHSMMPMNMQPQQMQRFPPPQYSQQTMHITRAGLPQGMQPMQRTMCGNSTMQYNYQTGAPRGLVPQMLANPQNMVLPDPMGYNLSPNNLGNSFNPTAQPQTNFKLKKLPFYEVISEIIKPTTMVGQERCSIPNPPRGMCESNFKIRLLPEDATHISMNRDMTNGKNEYLYQVQIRICLSEPGLNEISDFMPLGLHIRVCGKVCPLPPTTPNTRPGTEARRTPRPINCTQLMKLSPIVVNNIVINWNPDGKTYVISLYLVKKLTSEILLKRLEDKGTRSAEETKNNIIAKLADVDPDLATTSYRFSLVCPLGKMRMTLPAKSAKCDHLQCFDAKIFILMNEKKPTWMCPTCSKPCIYDDIQIESYFLEVVTSPSLPDDCKEIEIIADGTWKVYEEEKEPKSSGSVPNPKEKPIDSVDLDDDSDDGNTDNSTIQKPEVKPVSAIAKESEKLKSALIDLTLSDEDDNDKPRQENEAQAADAAQPAVEVTSKPFAQVQPQQAVTSSEQGVIIELDSPSPPSTSPQLPATPPPPTDNTTEEPQ